MLQLTQSFNFIWSNAIVILALVALVINAVRRNDYSLVIASAGFIFVSVFSLAYDAWLSNVFASGFDTVDIRYRSRYWMFISIFILVIAGHFLLKIKHNDNVKQFLMILLTCAVVNILLWLDRNLIPLNDLKSVMLDVDYKPNRYPSRDYWWLWDVYDIWIIVSDLLILYILMFGKHLALPIARTKNRVK